MDDVLARALESARAFVLEVHPGSAASALAGSIPAGRGTATSDLDIVIYYDDRAANFAETLRFSGWLVETFVYGPDALGEWFGREAEDRRPVALDMWANGIPLTGDTVAARLQERARGMLAAGPEPLSAREHADLRYALTAAVDDLDGQPNPGEELAIAADVFKRTGELLLLDGRRWLGTGKWLIRRLAQLNDSQAQDLIDWAQSPERSTGDLRRIAMAVLDSVGGPLQEGHVRGTKDPTRIYDR